MKTVYGRRLAPALAVLALAAAPAPAADLLIRHARVIDGLGNAPREDISILVRDGRIAAIGELPPAADVPVLDAAGASVLPGLIDSHVHLSVVPGATMRKDGPDTLHALRLQHLRAYLACGVTTVLDAGSEAEVARELIVALGGGAPGPRALWLGPPFTPPDGYGDFSRPVENASQVRAQFDVVQSIGGVGIKVMLEAGWSPFSSLPMHSAKIRRAIVEEAARRMLPLYVHATSERDYGAALDMGAHALMHAPLYRDDELSPEFLTRMLRSGAYQVSTLSVMDGLRVEFEPERLDDPLIRLTVPASELATARDPKAGRIHAESRVAQAASWLPPPARRAAAAYNFSDGAIREAVANARRALAAQNRAGIPIVVGSDSGNQPIVPYLFHGVLTLREIELLGGAGLSPAQAIAAATRTPARMLGLEQEIGTLEPGKRADLVIVRGDPLTDLRALRGVLWTVKDGVAKTPQEWMTR